MLLLHVDLLSHSLRILPHSPAPGSSFASPSSTSNFLPSLFLVSFSRANPFASSSATPALSPGAGCCAPGCAALGKSWGTSCSRSVKCCPLWSFSKRTITRPDEGSYFADPSLDWCTGCGKTSLREKSLRSICLLLGDYLIPGGPRDAHGR